MPVSKLVMKGRLLTSCKPVLGTPGRVASPTGSLILPVVGVTGLEPATSRPPAVRASQLRHTPIGVIVSNVYRFWGHEPHGHDHTCKLLACKSVSTPPQLGRIRDPGFRPYEVPLAVFTPAVRECPTAPHPDKSILYS